MRFDGSLPEEGRRRSLLKLVRLNSKCAMCMPIDKCVCIAFPIAKQLIASPLPLKLCQCVCVCVSYLSDT